MMTSLKIAATGMQAQQLNVDVLSNNLANINTVGFKRQMPVFRDLLYQSRIGIGSATSASTITPVGAQTGLGVSVGSIMRVHEQGSVLETGNTFDIAMQGRGYFQVNHPDGTTRYTRDGSFSLDNTGAIVTKEGFAVQPAITVPSNATEVTISPTGIITGKVNSVLTTFGQMTVAQFVNESGLEAKGDNYFIETEASGTPTVTNPTENGSGSMLQSHLEFSNVDPVEAVTNLITAQRAYELNSRIISTADEMLSAVNQIT